MRREAAFSLVGFLGGFVVAALAFWRPAEPQQVAQSAGARLVETAERPGPDSERGIARGRRPMVVRAEDSGVAGPVAVADVAPKRAADLLHEALAFLPGLDATKRQAAVNDLLAKLRAAGPERLDAVRDFFRAGQDVKFEGGYSTSNGRYIRAPSLRVALLDALSDWPEPEVLELTREVLRSTPRMSEAAIAIRQIEAKSPGMYRAEAIQSLQQLGAAPLEKEDFFTGGSTLVDALRHFQAPELIPAAEKLAATSGWAAAQFLHSLGDFSPDVRTPAIERLFSRPDVVKQLASQASMLRDLNYGDPVISQNMARMFSSDMDRKSREKLLENFGSNSRSFFPGSLGNFGNASVAVRQPSDTERLASLQGKLEFLDAIAPQCTTAVLQERLADAREEVNKSIANPPVTIQGSGIRNTLIRSSSSTVTPGAGGSTISVPAKK